jgi:formate hydrogenlyase subunit 6/NADH:ubiquinone oxidoreductase subunit I
MKCLAQAADQWPWLDPCRCTACGLCVAICPTQCLEQTATGPWLVRPLDCLACAACVRLCPRQALQLISLDANETEISS